MSAITANEPIAKPVESVDTGWVPARLYRMTLEQYEAMVASGAFTGRDRFQLINGYLVEKMTPHPPHASACDASRLAIESTLPVGWFARPEKPLCLPAQTSEPGPDGVVARATWRDYTRRHPGPEDVALVAEVADSSLAEDRKMAAIYGDAGIAVYWIINLVDRQVEVYGGAGPGGYTTRGDYKPGQQVPLVIDGREVGRIAVDDLLP